MDEERQSAAEEIFEAAADLPPEERAQLLSRRCGDDVELRALVDQFLADYDGGMGSFLQPSAESTKSQTAPEPRSSDPTTVGRYRILETIGQGGMGTVYAAEQTEPVRRKVAVKVIKAGMDSRQAIARFEAERQALAVMDHPNVARVLDAGETEQGRLYFVMDLVRGEPITAYCDRHMLSTEQRLALFVPVCHAVQHAHQKGIIHRDIKPSNILVTTSDGQPLPKIIDFGIAKATTTPLTDKTLYTRQGHPIGTPAYMSPEQAEAGPVYVDTRSDIYSLGVVLYELLTGALPFDSATWRNASPVEIQRMLREEDPPKPSTKVRTGDEHSAKMAKCRRTDPRTLARKLKGELDWIALKAMEKSRDRRYETASSLATDIHRYLRNEPIAASPPSLIYRLRKYVRRHSVALGVATTVLLTLVGALIYSRVQWKRMREARDESDAVTAFLAEMLASVKPSERGRDVTVLEILEEASEAIGERFDDRPRIEARLQHTVGNTYEALGEYETAARHLERASDLRREVLGPDRAETLQSLYHLAYSIGMSNRLGKTDDAVAILQDVIERQTRTLGDGHIDTLDSIQVLLLLLKDQRRYQEAESLAISVIESRSPELGTDHKRLIKIRYTLALIYERQGRYDEAVALMERSVAAARKLVGDDDPYTLEFICVLARLYSHLDRFTEAEPLHLEALNGRRRVEGAESPWTLRSMTNLADMYAQQTRYDDAEQLYREVIEVASRTRGAEDQRTIVAKERLAEMWLTLGRYDRAESLFVDAVAVRRRADDPSTLSLMRKLTKAYIGQRRYEDAERLQLEILSVQRRALGEGHSDLRWPLYNLACLASLRGQQTPALEWLRKAIDHGFSDADWLAQDPDLAVLHADPRFQALVDEARQAGHSAIGTGTPSHKPGADMADFTPEYRTEE